jgi:acyl dehydratase
MTALRLKAFEGLRAGDVIEISRTFTETEVSQFADISRDYNPVHLDDRFVREKKLKSRICHGLLVASMVTEIGGQLGWLASQMDFRFIKPVYFGDTITCRMSIDRINERGALLAKSVFTNQNNQVVIESEVKAIHPNGRELGVMRQMMKEGDPTNRLK